MTKTKNPQSDPDDEKSGKERRKYQRIQKSFILSYFDKVNPNQKYELTQLKNISQGGVCFITTQAFQKGKMIGIELRTPYLTDTTYLEGEVLQSHEKVKNMLYETRLEFRGVNSQAEFLLSKLIEYFIQEENGQNNREK